MIKAKDIYKQIKNLTIGLIRMGLSEDQNFPSFKNLRDNIEEVSVNVDGEAIFLKNVSYEEMYSLLCQKRMFNIKMIDGALIQMQYRFRKGIVEKHRLAFIPSPNLEPFQNDPDIYLKDEMYNDVLDKRIVTVPLRFDFDNGEDESGKKISVPVVHPISHLTLGQYKNCRIPVSSALTPCQLVKFIVMNFYDLGSNVQTVSFFNCQDSFESTLYPEEKKLIKVCTPE